jgi:hypothetical protein
MICLSRRTLTLLLLAAIAAMTFFWKPWDQSGIVRTISAQGQAIVSAANYKYQFQPIFACTDVRDVDIRTTINASSNLKPMPLGATVPQIAVSEPNGMLYPTTNDATYTITATVNDKAFAQKVSDYLATTKNHRTSHPHGRIH